MVSATSGWATVNEREVPLVRTWTTSWPEPYQVPPGPAATANGVSVAPAMGVAEVTAPAEHPAVASAGAGAYLLCRVGEPVALVSLCRW